MTKEGSFSWEFLYNFTLRKSQMERRDRMTEKQYLAHLSPSGETQSILAHLQGTAKLAERFVSAFHADAQGRQVGLCHDIGKYSADFQIRLRGGPKVDHATAGALKCYKMDQEFAAFCVAGHHTGLPDLGTPDDPELGTLYGRLKQAVLGEIPDYSAWVDEVTLAPADVPAFCRKNPLTDAFFTRMLYSCLVDADYLDIEQFMQQGEVERGSKVTILELNRRLDAFVAAWFPPEGALNEKRCQILQNCMQMRRQKAGLFTLTVPTGGGKTGSILGVCATACGGKWTSACHLCGSLYFRY